METLETIKLSNSSHQLGLNLPHKSRDLERTQNGSMIMNERNLKIICENQGLYEYPEMNTKLYLHFKVIQKIQCLDKYVNLKTIYLQNNVITKIENLDCLVHLQNLFLQNNMIKKIQNLEKLKELKVINLNNNNIFKIQGLSELPHLQNLSLSHNYITQFQDLEHLGHCTSELTSIDLSQNQIKANDKMLNLIPQIKCLYLSGNPLVRETKHYRRVVVGTLKNLLYLDQRGIDKEQRMLSQAWVQGGQKAYKQAKQKVLQHRQNLKLQRSQQIMKDIDVHRNRKIGIFLRNIKEFQQQIQKLRGYMNEKGNQDMGYFYESKIAELYEKIRQNQQFVTNINKRIGASAKSISSSQSVNSEEQVQGGNKIGEEQMVRRSVSEKDIGQGNMKELKEYDDQDDQDDNDDKDQMQTSVPVTEQAYEKDEQYSYVPKIKQKTAQKQSQQLKPTTITITPAQSSSGLDELD